jgi:hypothetical protein
MPRLPDLEGYCESCDRPTRHCWGEHNEREFLECLVCGRRWETPKLESEEG